MIHYFYGTLQVGIGQTLCSFEHVSCINIVLVIVNFVLIFLHFRHYSNKGGPGVNLGGPCAWSPSESEKKTLMK